MKIELENGYVEYGVDDVDSNELVIEMLMVKEKRRGTGTELVNKVIEIAREKGMSLGLCAYPQDNSIDLSNLINFYKGLGFVEECNDGCCAIMKYVF